MFPSKVVRIITVLLVAVGVVESTTISLPAADGVPPAAAPGDASKGKHIFKHYCAVCHGLSGAGNGPNAKYLDPSPADLTRDEMASFSDDEIYEVIEKGGFAVDLAPAMPPWGKTLSSGQITSLVAYIRTLGESAEKAVRLADVVSGGEKECRICHIPQSTHQIAPNLAGEGTKLNRAWLDRFLTHPEQIRPVGFIPLTKTKMPNFYFSKEERAALVAFLMDQKDARVGSVEGLSLSDEDGQAGRDLFFDTYSCDACHKPPEGGNGGIVGPDLSKSSKRLKPDWVFAWLKDPQSIRPDSPMPNFGIPDSELRQLVAYIMGDYVPEAEPAHNKALIAGGEDLIKQKNCLYCHSMINHD